VKFLLQAPIDHIDPQGEFQCGEGARAIALVLERAGVSGAVISEHPAPSAAWLHSDAAAHDTLDPFTGLAFLAAATTRLKVVSNVVVLPLRNPFLTAKAASTLQVLSDGRFIMGAGIGYQKEEFDALGVPFTQRGALADEALETIRLVWKGGTVVKKGRYFNAVGNESRPVPSPPPPIWIAGASDRAVERAARWGDGWMPHFAPPTHDAIVKASSVTSMEHLGEKIARLNELRAQTSRTAPFDIIVGGPFRPKAATRADAEEFIENTRQLESRGATWTWTKLPAPSRAAYLENVAWFGEAIIAEFKKT
jgi:probable F420-dependent oxidoreductase